MNLTTAGRGLLHEGLAAGLVSADAASILKALEIFGATLLILDVCILSVWFRTAIRRSGLSGAGSFFAVIVVGTASGAGGQAVIPDVQEKTAPHVLIQGLSRISNRGDCI